MLPTVTDETFKEKVLDSSLPVLVKFTASWCQPCKTMGDILRDLTPELQDHVRFLECDIETSPVACNTYSIWIS